MILFENHKSTGQPVFSLSVVNENKFIDSNLQVYAVFKDLLLAKFI